MLGKEITAALANQKIDFIGTNKSEADICSVGEKFIQQNQITHIINCAAYTQVDKAETEQEKAHLINGTGVKHLGSLSKKYHLPILHFSTDYVFDGSSKVPYNEEGATNPLNVYGSSKREGEIVLLQETPYACLIRTSWLFGLQGNNFVQTMIKLMQERETLSIVSDQIGRPTYAPDLAEFAIQMLGQMGIYHFANADEASWYSFAKEIHQTGLSLGFPFKTKELKAIPTSEYPTPAKRPTYSTLSTQKIEKEFQIIPRPWQNGLKEYLNAKKRS